jgi:hypothetical protein
MKTITILLGLTLMLLPLPLQAMPVYVAMFSKDIIDDAQKLESVDVAITTFGQGFNGVFLTSRITIESDRVIAMKGGVKSITRILNPYGQYLVTPPAGSGYLGLYVCKVKNKLSKNVTYVFIHKTGFDIAPCLNPNRTAPAIYVRDILAALATLPRR